MAVNGVVPAHPGELLLRKRAWPAEALVRHRGRGVPGRGVPGRGAGRAAWIVTNPTARDITENISVAGWDDVSDLFGEKLTIHDESVVLAVSNLDVRVLILDTRNSRESASAK